MSLTPETTTTLVKAAANRFYINLESECGLYATRKIIRQTNGEWRIKDSNGTWYGDFATFRAAARSVMSDFRDEVSETFEAALEHERLEAERLAA